MHLRPLERGDLTACATLAAASSINDPLYAHLCPHRHEHPDDWWSFMLETVKGYFTQRECWGTVCVSDELDGENDKGEEIVIGFCFWERIPASKYSHAEQAWIPKNVSFASAVERTLLGITSTWNGLLPNRNNAVDPKQALAYAQARRDQKPFLPLKYGFWELKSLHVQPEHQHCGIGSSLLGWGQQHATRERVPCTLVVSSLTQEFYAKKGFKVIDAIYVPGLSQADPAMIWNPRKQWARDLKEGEEVTKLGLKIEAVWTDKAKEGLDDGERARLPNFQWSELTWRHA